MALSLKKCVPRSRRRSVLLLTMLTLSLLCSLLLVRSLQTTHAQTRPQLLTRDHSSRETTRENSLQREEWPQFRAVHLDLKGAPPTVHYLQELFPVIAALGANALLLEYEDMFPFSGHLEHIRASNAFTRQHVQQLVEAATRHGLHVIPLVQTFGHLEFALKLESMVSLREVPALPQAICPKRNASLELIQEMVDQVLELHPHSRFLHIGCDEVFHIGLCEVCRLQDRDRLFLDHVRHVAKHVVSGHAGVIPIIWDDMLRQMSSETIRESRIADLGVEPMIWTYVKDIYRFVSEPQFQLYAQLFPHVWTASAFKGAFGETLTLPNIKMHLENHLAWREVMHEQARANHVHFRGIALTGWSRYDHLATLCELLPAAVPSLALGLLALKNERFDPRHVFRAFDKALQCPARDLFFGENSDSALQAIEERDANLLERAQDCRFPGWQVLALMRSLRDVKSQVESYLYDVTEHKAWLTDYSVRHNMSSPFRVDEALQEFQSQQYALQSLVRTAREALEPVYDQFTVAEWIEQHIYPLIQRMDKLWNDSVNLKKARIWPRRPLPISDELRRVMRV